MKRDGCALAFAILFPSVLTWVYFVALSGDPAERGGLQIAAYALGKVIQFSFPAVFVFLCYRSELRLSPPNARGLTFGLLFGVAASAGMLVLYFGWLRNSTLMSGTPELVGKKLAEFHLTTPLRYLGFAVFLSIGHSLLEEYYWRWFVFLRLRRMITFRSAVVLSCVGFMAHHVIVLAQYFPGPLSFVILVIPFSLGVAVGGAVCAWLYERTGTFYAPWLSHLIVDAAIMGIGYDMVAGRLG